MPVPQHRVILARHGETEWSRSRRHTGRSDIPLTDTGQAQARALAGALARFTISACLVSPLARARQTAALALPGVTPQVDDRLQEWDYGDYEGLTLQQVRQQRPGWTIWNGGVPGGETIDEVAARARAVIQRVREIDGDVCVIAHGHVLRILTCCWLELAPVTAARLMLDTAAVSVLSYEHDTAALALWNDCGHLRGER